MWSKLFSFALLATTFLHADAACNFRSRALIFPDCNEGATDTACPFTMSEVTPDGDTDDNVTVAIRWNNAFPDVADNTYFLLDRAESQTGSGAVLTNLDYNPATSGPATQLSAAGTVYKTFPLKAPVSTDCSDVGCSVTYHVAIMIGAAPACTGYDDAAHIYTRAVYKFQITQQWLRINGVVDFSNWNDVNVENAFITQSDETKTVVQYEAENVQVVDQFTLTSHLDIVDNNGDALSNGGICLGEGEAANFQETDANAGTVANTNSLVECDARAVAHIVQSAQYPTGSKTSGYEDTDTELTKHNDYNDDGYVTVSVSQYSQINATKDNGGESTSPSRPGSYAVSLANQNAVASGGDDYRWDVIEASSSATGAAGADPSQTVTVNTATTHSSATFRSDCLDGTHTFGTYSIAQGGTDRVRALAAVRYRLVAPAGPAEAAQSPIIYVAAWYTHSIPQEADYNVGHDEYTHTNHDTQADGSAYSATTNTRRLRSARTLLRAAAAEKVATPQSASRVHLLHVRLMH